MDKPALEWLGVLIGRTRSDVIEKRSFRVLKPRPPRHILERQAIAIVRDED